MPPSSNQFVITVAVNLQNGVSAVAQNIQSSVQGMGASIQTNVQGIQNAFGNMAQKITATATAFIALNQGVALLGGAFQGLIAPIQEGIAKWSEAALAAKQLEVAWESSGRKLPLSELQEFNAELAKSTTASVGGLTKATKVFAGVAQITDEQMPRFLKLAADISAFRGIDIESAAYRLSLVAQGSYMGLTRMGIKLSQNAKESRDLNVILGEIDKRVGGMAASAMETWAGKSIKINETWEGVKKLLGEVVGTAFLSTLDGMLERSRAFLDFLKAANKAGQFEGIKAVLSTIGTSFLAVKDAIYDGLKKIATAAAELFVGKKWDDQTFSQSTVQRIQQVRDVIVSIIQTLASIGENKWVLYAGAAYIGFKTVSGILGIIGSLIVGVGSRIMGLVTNVQTLIASSTALSGALAVVRTAAISAWTALLAPLAAAAAAVGAVVGAVLFLGYAVDQIGSKFGTFAKVVATLMTGPIAPLIALLSWMFKLRREGQEIDAENDKYYKKLADNAKKGGYVPGQKAEPIEATALAAISTQDLETQLAKEKAIRDGARNEEYEARKKEAGLSPLNIAGRREAAEASKAAHETMLGSMENINLIEKEKASRKGITDEIREAIRSANELAQSEAWDKAAKRAQTFEERVKAISDAFDLAIKTTNAFQEALKKQDEIDLQNTKNQITATSQSAEDAAVRTTQAETNAASIRIARAQAVFDITSALRKKNHDEQLEAINREIEKNPEADTKAFAVKRAEIEKAYNDGRIEDEKRVTESISTELSKQTQDLQKHLEARRELENKATEAQIAGAKALSDINTKAVSEFDRLKVSFREASEDLKRAVDILPTQPQKAIELAEKARGAFVSLAQDIRALKQNVLDTDKTYAELFRDLAKKGMSPVAAWQSDVQHVISQINDAKAMAAAGDYKGAQQLAKDAANTAKALAESGPESVSTDQARLTAFELIKQAADVGKGAAKADLQRAETANKQLTAQVVKANETVKNALDGLKRITETQITHLQAVTQALQNVYSALTGKTGARSAESGGLTPGQTTAPETTGQGTPSTQVGAPSSAPGTVGQALPSERFVGGDYGTPGAGPSNIAAVSAKVREQNSLFEGAYGLGKETPEAPPDLNAQYESQIQQLKTWEQMIQDQYTEGKINAVDVAEKTDEIAAQRRVLQADQARVQARNAEQFLTTGEGANYQGDSSRSAGFLANLRSQATALQGALARRRDAMIDQAEGWMNEYRETTSPEKADKAKAEQAATAGKEIEEGGKNFAQTMREMGAEIRDQIKEALRDTQIMVQVNGQAIAGTVTRI